MCPLSGKRIKPFHIPTGSELKGADIRLPIIRHMEHELEGVFPPYGSTHRNLLWAEVGVILDDNIVWICIPGVTFQLDGSFKERYKNAVVQLVASCKDTVVSKPLKFTYNSLLEKMQGAEEIKESHENLLKSHFFTVQVSYSKPCGMVVAGCEIDTHSVEGKNKNILDSINAIMGDGCTCNDFCKLIEFANNEIVCDAKIKAQTFFLIFAHGTSCDKANSESLRKDLIGAALFNWIKSSPNTQEVLYLRRQLINTIWLELGTKLKILNLDKQNLKIFTLIMLAIEKKPFNSSADHDDSKCITRREICGIFSEVACCVECEAAKARDVKIAELKGGEESTDFCGNIDEYKGMFEHNAKSFHVSLRDCDRSKYKIDNKMLFKTVAKYFDLEISTNGLEEVVLPYSPSWLFLATIKNLEGMLKNSKLEIFNKKGYWGMSIIFDPMSCASLTEDFTKLRLGLTGMRRKGDLLNAIDDVIYGKLGSRAKLSECVRGIYRDSDVTKSIFDNNNGNLMKATVIQAKNKIQLNFTWSGNG